MVITILIWSYIFFLSFSLAGGLFSVLLGKNKHSDITEVNFFLFVLSGLILISFFISVFFIIFQNRSFNQFAFWGTQSGFLALFKTIKARLFYKDVPWYQTAGFDFSVGGNLFQHSVDEYT